MVVSLFQTPLGSTLTALVKYAQQEYGEPQGVMKA
jgi:hypothetical protein